VSKMIKRELVVPWSIAPTNGGMVSEVVSVW